MSNLYQDAILDAKAVRASVIANTKAALEEAFEPKIKEMFRSQIVEELEETENMEEVEEVEGMEEGTELEGDSALEDEGYNMNEEELEEILSQLEELSNTEESLQEAEDDEETSTEDDETEMTDDETEEESEEEMADDTKIIDITLGDLKQVLQSVVSGQTGLDDLGTKDMTDDAAEETDTDITLDEILAELEEESIEENYDEMEEGLGSAISGGLKKFGSSIKKALGTDCLKDRKAALAAGKSDKEAYQVYADCMRSEKGGKQGISKLGGAGEEQGASFKTDWMKKESAELQEAKKTIEILRKDLQEVNLLNAKYLYMNKLFKKQNLTEAQKVKVVNALDRAISVTEVKNTYETLKESLEVKKTQQLKESIGFASQAAGVAPKANIVESDPFIAKWQKLAGIK